MTINDYYTISSKFWNSQISLAQEICSVAGIPTDDSSNWQDKGKKDFPEKVNLHLGSDCMVASYNLNFIQKTYLQRILYRKHVLRGGKEMDKF